MFSKRSTVLLKKSEKNFKSNAIILETNEKLKHDLKKLHSPSRKKTHTDTEKCR